MKVPMKMTLIITAVFLLFTHTVFAASYQVSGAPDAGVNGVYIEDGTSTTGAVKYSKEGGWELRQDDIMSHVWVIRDGSSSPNSTLGVYYWNWASPSPSLPPNDGNWTDTQAGAIPGLTVTEVQTTYTVYIPHITSGYDDWDDILQVDNDSMINAVFTITLFGGNVMVYSKDHSAPGHGEASPPINLKDLSEQAETGMITFTNPYLRFRITYENAGGGLAEFALDETLASTLGLYFSDFTPSITLKGAVIANMSDAMVNVTIHAVGEGSVLDSYTTAIGPHGKLVGTYSDFFPSVPFGDIKKIIAVAGSSSVLLEAGGKAAKRPSSNFCLSGLVINSNAILSHMLFTRGVVLLDFYSSLARAFPPGEACVQINMSGGEIFNAIMNCIITATKSNEGGTFTQIGNGFSAHGVWSTTFNASDSLSDTISYTIEGYTIGNQPEVLPGQGDTWQNFSGPIPDGTAPVEFVNGTGAAQWSQIIDPACNINGPLF
ncbi:MAG: hypothetical protein V1793_22605 [Pseudomonadota bacterium]